MPFTLFDSILDKLSITLSHKRSNSPNTRSSTKVNGDNNQITTIATTNITQQITPQPFPKKSITGLAFASQTELESSHISERVVNLSELAAQSDSMLVSTRGFEKCEIRGPALLALLEGNTFNSCGFNGEIDNVFLAVDEGSHILGAIGIEGCTFDDCEFVGVGIIGTRENVQEWKRNFRASKP